MDKEGNRVLDDELSRNCADSGAFYDRISRLFESSFREFDPDFARG